MTKKGIVTRGQQIEEDREFERGGERPVLRTSDGRADLGESKQVNTKEK